MGARKQQGKCAKSAYSEASFGGVVVAVDEATAPVFHSICTGVDVDRSASERTYVISDPNPFLAEAILSRASLNMAPSDAKGLAADDVAPPPARRSIFSRVAGKSESQKKNMILERTPVER
jgi:hypothetical protein